MIPKLRKFIWPFLVLVLGVCISSFISWKLYEKNMERAQDNFERLAHENFISISAVINWHNDALINLSSYFLASESVDQDEYSVFVSPILEIHESFDELGWIMRMESAEQFENSYSHLQKDYPAKKLPTITDGKIAFPYDFLSHIEPNMIFHHLLGTAASADKNFLEMIRIAEKKQAISLFLKPLPILGMGDMHSHEKGHGYEGHNDHLIMLKPAFEKGDKKNIKGFAFSFVDVEELLNDAFRGKGEKDSYIDVRIEKELPTGERSILFVNNKALLDKSLNRLPFEYQQSLRLDNARMVFSFYPKDNFLRNHIDINVIVLMLALCGFSFAIAYYLLISQKNYDVAAQGNAKMQAILNMAGDAIITINEKGIIQSFNKKAEDTFGYSTTEATGKNISMLMPPGHREQHDKYLMHSSNAEILSIISEVRELQGQRKDGTIFPIELAVTEAKTGKERVFVGVARDISERKKFIDELEQRTNELEVQAEDLAKARRAAEESTRLKSEFLANMSHEIRTPMNGVIGMTNLLLETELDATQKHYAHTAMGSAENLLQLVNDILDFSKIEAGKLEFEIIPFDLQALVEEVADIIAIKAQEKDLEILLRFAPDMPRYVMGDPGRVRQIFHNLGSNALKFTETGHILLGVDFKEEKDGKVGFSAYVEDTGIGIPEDKQDYIFNKFSQADGSTTRKFGGTGLGLAICKELTHRMNGDVGVESTQGVGSIFWFTFQLARERESQERDLLDFSANLSGIRIIIADDNKTAQDIAVEHLRKNNMDITVTSSGEEALEAMKAAAAEDKPFEMAVVDHMMPGMDGLELAKAIKKDKALKDISLLMISSTPCRGDNERMQDIGFSGYLTKPVSGLDIAKALSAIHTMREGKSIFKIITRHTLREDSTRRGEVESENTTFGGAQILLGEDNPTNQQVAITMLEKMGCHVTPAGNGIEAIKLIKQQRFDLVFMDCNMPEMDGFEATKAIRKLEDQEETKRTPIVALTAYAMKGDDQKCYDAGMDDYITKPVKKQDLMNVLRKWLSKGKISKDEKKDKKTKKKKIQSQDVDKEILSQMKELMGEKFGLMVEKYLEKSAEYITQAEKAIANGNAKLLADSVHPLKSSSASLGAIKVSELAADLEHKADAIGDSDKGGLVPYSTILEELRTSFEECEDILRKETKN